MKKKIWKKRQKDEEINYKRTNDRKKGISRQKRNKNYERKTKMKKES